jgi:stringent starvation protein B
MENQILTTTKPYLVRALYEWIVDNECTPYVIINADAENVEVPKQYIEDGRIILNVSEEAVRDFQITNEYLEFNARFNGVATQVYSPVAAILAIYAQENGHGMVFSEEDMQTDMRGDQNEKNKDIKRPDPNVKHTFKVIKGDKPKL